MKVKIGNKIISRKSPVFIIAEAGVNHNGRLDLALKLIDMAADAGADAIKFQTFRAEQVVIRAGHMAEYQKKNIGKAKSQIEMLRKLEFDELWYPKIIAHCKKRGIIFLSTPHGSFDSVDLLHKLKVPAFKFGSGDLTSLPVLEYAAKLGKPIILGTGMATIAEIQEALKVIKKTGNSKIILLHCTTNYPCPPQEANLGAMLTMTKEFDVLIGYSDHTMGSQVSVMAVTLGACVVERHLTLDNNMPGPDHKASANPMDFKRIVLEIRRVKTIIGSSVKKPLSSEIALRSVVRKSIVAIKDIKKGEIFSSKNIGIKRPGTGLSPKYYFSILSKTCLSNIKVDTLISKKHYEK